jgi:ribonuclease HI/probable phosphoglycerate mutase
MRKLIIHIDGGARGNPGPSALGVSFSKETGEMLKEFSQCLGKKTNNEAEYMALIFALKKIKVLFGKEKIKHLPIEIKSDSELLIKQMNGQYKIKESSLQKLFIEAWNLKIGFKDLKFCSVPREKNKRTDKLVNEILDAELNVQKLF